MRKIKYSELKGQTKKQEQYNFQKVSGLLAEYGLTTIKLADDRNGADFIALSMIEDTTYKVQLKGNLTFDKKYIGKNLYMCFIDQTTKNCYLYLHDVVLEQFINDGNISGTSSWDDKGHYFYSSLTTYAKEALEQYFIGKI